ARILQDADRPLRFLLAELHRHLVGARRHLRSSGMPVLRRLFLGELLEAVTREVPDGAVQPLAGRRREGADHFSRRVGDADLDLFFLLSFFLLPLLLLSGLLRFLSLLLLGFLFAGGGGLAWNRGAQLPRALRLLFARLFFLALGLPLLQLALPLLLRCGQWQAGSVQRVGEDGAVGLVLAAELAGAQTEAAALGRPAVLHGVARAVEMELLGHRLLREGAQRLD